MALIDEFKDRLGGSSSQQLIELTNYSSSATTINSTVLEKACADAQGEFQRITGISFDVDNTSHVAVCIPGVFYFLELYKNREGAMIQTHYSKFYQACLGLQGKTYISPSTNSRLSPSRDSQNALPDMDRGRRIFRNQRNTRIAEISDDP